MAGKAVEFWNTMRPGKRRALSKTPDGRLQDLVDTTKTYIRAKDEPPFCVIKQLFGFQKMRLRGMVKNRCKVNVLAALTNLFLARRHLLGRGESREWSTRMRPFAIAKQHQKGLRLPLMRTD
ncbi:hypothetical protein KBY96_14550 [Cyanobium sp. ATX 6A2]|uniref:hypothetical protein n=1 Tax=Cyanobium sp. ATX 6A2 TaxID=2823700 RepID=UPI0020CCB83D|nr:hypothetical protein [Cyanobium sp. ATX 6A2]MCP9889142.1 hypothetical protein [Cyanobium sp. ATX 6A2]